MSFVHAVKWDVPGFDPATLQAMADEFGSIHEDVQAGRKTRWRIYLGKRDGRALYVTGPPTRLGKPPRFESRQQAELILGMMRGAILSGDHTADEVIDAYMPTEYTKELVELHLERYLEHWRAQVRSGARSPNSLRELERWAHADGLWSWWFGRDIRRLTNGDAIEWTEWLAVRPSQKRGAEAGEPIGPGTQANASGGFLAFLRWTSTTASTGAGRAWEIPNFPTIDRKRKTTATITPERVFKIIEAIPWEIRGIFLAQAGENVRFGSACAILLEDLDPKTLELHWHRARQGRGLDSPIGAQKNGVSVRREPWLPELRKWLEYRLALVDPEDAIAKRATALFWNPRAENPDLSFAYDAYLVAWRIACKKVGESIAPQAALRNSILSRLAEVLTPATLQAQSMHKDRRSLDHYTSGAKPDPVAMVQAIRPGRNRGNS